MLSYPDKLNCRPFLSHFKGTPSEDGAKTICMISNLTLTDQGHFKCRRKCETRGVRKEANVRYWSKTVAIEACLPFEHAASVNLISFSDCNSKIIGDYF